MLCRRPWLHLERWRKQAFLCSGRVDCFFEGKEVVDSGSAFLPPACASVIWAFVVALLLTIRSNSLPTLLDSVVPLSFEHFPLVPLPLYSLVMFAFSHCSGMLPFSRMWLSIFRYTLWVFPVAFRKISLGMLSGPEHFSFPEGFYSLVQFFSVNVSSFGASCRIASTDTTILLCNWSTFCTGDCVLGQYIVPHSTLRYALCVRLGLLL